VVSYGKRKSTPVLLEVGNARLAEYCEVADAFARHFQSVNNTPSSRVSPSFRNPLIFVSRHCFRVGHL
jgi:hypothetical protein